MCMYVVICKIDHCIHIHWCIPMGLGHNDPWVESHMWPQQTWGQRSSTGQWPLVQVFGKKVSVSTYFDVFSNLILQWLQKYVVAKTGETRGSRTALLQMYYFEIYTSFSVVPQFLYVIGFRGSRSHSRCWYHSGGCPCQTLLCTRQRRPITWTKETPDEKQSSWRDESYPDAWEEYDVIR